MARPSMFGEDRPDVLRDMIRAHPLATLVTHGESGLAASLVPFTLVTRDDGPDILRAHMATGNEQFADLRQGAEALVIFQGPQAYISPGWYPTKKEHGRAVPTWNYVVVKAWGRPAVIDDADWLLTQIDALTAQQEQGMPEPWSVADAPGPFIDALVKGIAGIELPIERIEGIWKVSQNQPEVNRRGVASGLRSGGLPSTMADIVEAPR